MNISRSIVINAIFKSQFSYCPFAWMCHSRANSKISRLYESRLQLIYSDKQSSFGTLLEKHGSVPIYNRNLQTLANKTYKIKNDLSPVIVLELFEKKNEQHYDLRNNAQFTIPPIETVYHGSEGISFVEPKIWSIFSTG